MTAELRSSLRKSLRQSRRALTPRQQRQAALHMMRLALRQSVFHAARHIAFYQPIDGEIDPGPLMQRALREGKACYLPVVRGSRMYFVRFDHYKRMRRNRWGIREPFLDMKMLIAPWALDLVYVPLTGFDRHGTRLGMGKGFYDRTFQFRHTRKHFSPRLAGLGHECQRRDALPRESWDIAMDYIITDRAIIKPAPARIA